MIHCHHKSDPLPGAMKSKRDCKAGELNPGFIDALNNQTVVLKFEWRFHDA